MPQVLPIAIKLADGGTMVVSSISDAKKALGGRWKNKEAAGYRDAVRLVDDAMNGIFAACGSFCRLQKSRNGTRADQAGKAKRSVGNA